MVSNSLAGPLYSGTFTLGLELGGFWIGLPFVFAGGLVALAIAGSMCIEEQNSYKMVPSQDMELEEFLAV